MLESYFNKDIVKEVEQLTTEKMSIIFIIIRCSYVYLLYKINDDLLIILMANLKIFFNLDIYNHNEDNFDFILHMALPRGKTDAVYRHAIIT